MDHCQLEPAASPKGKRVWTCRWSMEGEGPFWLSGTYQAFRAPGASILNPIYEFWENHLSTTTNTRPSINHTLRAWRESFHLKMEGSPRVTRGREPRPISI